MCIYAYFIWPHVPVSESFQLSILFHQLMSHAIEPLAGTLWEIYTYGVWLLEAHEFLQWESEGTHYAVNIMWYLGSGLGYSSVCISFSNLRLYTWQLEFEMICLVGVRLSRIQNVGILESSCPSIHLTTLKLKNIILFFPCVTWLICWTNMRGISIH